MVSLWQEMFFRESLTLSLSLSQVAFIADNIPIIRYKADQWRIYIVKFWTCPPGVQILSNSCSFWENLAKLYVGTPLGSWCPLLREILDLPLQTIASLKSYKQLMEKMFSRTITNCTLSKHKWISLMKHIPLMSEPICHSQSIRKNCNFHWHSELPE